MPRGLIPAALTFLLLGAHFLRIGNIPIVLALIVCIALLMVQKPWARVVTTTVLVLGLLNWVLTISGIAMDRIANGAPWIRMAAIMTGVLLLNLYAALHMRHERIRAWFSPVAATEDPA